MTLRVISVAILSNDGVIQSLPPPYRHHHVLHAVHRPQNGVENDLIIAGGIQGFLLSNGEFANRKGAAEIALSSGQIKTLQHPPLLYSEDLW